MAKAPKADRAAQGEKTAKRAPGHAAPKKRGDLGTQLVSLLVRSSHPRLAVVASLTGLVGALLSHRGIGQSLAAAAALLVVWVATGIGNDVADRAGDASAPRPHKPVAEGVVPPGNASFAVICLSVLAVPLSLENGTVAGLCLLATLPVAWLYNPRLHRTLFSWLPWAVTFVLIAFFFAYGGWGLGVHGSAPSWPVIVSTAVLGVGIHLVTSAPGLVADNKTDTRHLPLRLALKVGAGKLMLIGVVISVLGLAGLITGLLTVGLHG